MLLVPEVLPSEGMPSSLGDSLPPHAAEASPKATNQWKDPLRRNFLDI
jgi:hypothetical protein